MKVNLQNPENTSLHGGPAVFTRRLRAELMDRGSFSEDDYDVWMNLSFRPVPREVFSRSCRIV